MVDNYINPYNEEHYQYSLAGLSHRMSITFTVSAVSIHALNTMALKHPTLSLLKKPLSMTSISVKKSTEKSSPLFTAVHRCTYVEESYRDYGGRSSGLLPEDLRTRFSQMPSVKLAFYTAVLAQNEKATEYLRSLEPEELQKFPGSVLLADMS